MYEVLVLTQSKETANKLRYGCDVDGVVFYVYIPINRVPDPYPQQIRVTIDSSIRFRQSKTGFSDPRKEPIIVIIKKFEKCTKTYRYRQVEEDVSEWEIGDPYIPLSLLSEPSPELLTIKVDWDYSKGNWKME